MKVTSKGQVTIPQHLREKVGIMPGCEVEFVLESGALLIRKTDGHSRGWDIVRRMTGKGDVKMTTDEIMAMTLGED